MAKDKDKIDDRMDTTNLTGEQEDKLEGGEVIRQEEVKVGDDEVSVAEVDTRPAQASKRYELVAQNRAMNEYVASDGTRFSNGQVVAQSTFEHYLDGATDRNGKKIFDKKEVK